MQTSLERLVSGSVASHDVNRYSGVRLGVDCLRDRHKPGVHALQLNEHVVCTPRYSCTDILVRACSRGSHNWYSRRPASLVSTVVHNAPQQLTFLFITERSTIWTPSRQPFHILMITSHFHKTPSPCPLRSAFPKRPFVYQRPVAPYTAT